MARATGRGAQTRARRRGSRSPVALGLALGLAYASTAAAQQLDFRWSAPPGCPSRAAARARLAEYLGGAPRDEARVDVTITRGGAGVLSARITVEHAGASGTRRLEDADCGVLADAAVFAAAVVIDPAIDRPPAARALAPSAGAAATLADETATPADATAASAGASDATPGPEAREIPIAERPTSPTAPEQTDGDAVAAADGEGALVLRAEGAAAVGVLPGLAPGIGLALGHELGPALRLELSGRWLPARAAHRAPVPGTAGTLSLAEAGIRTCMSWGDGSPAFPLCAGLRAGAVLGRGGDALQPPRDERVAWLAVELALSLRWPLARWLALHAELSPLLPVLRPRLGIDGLGTLHRSAAVALSGSAGLEVRFR